VKNGAVHGTTKLVGIFQSNGADATLSAGDMSDLWGGSWAPADWNAETSGVEIQIQNGAVPGYGQSISSMLDGVTLTIYYEDAAGATWTVDVNHVQMVVHTITGSARFLYAASGNQLTKLSFASNTGEPVVTLQSVQSFTHGPTNAAPSISDIVVVKDGRVPNPAILIGFGKDAPIQQITSIAASGADTYQTISGTPAYAGQFATALGANNTDALVWKSLGVSGEATGAFARINSSTITNAAKDYTNLQNWTPRSDTQTPYQVGDYDSDITALAEYQRSLVAAKPNGVYAFDQNVNAYLIFSTQAYKHPDNGRRLLAWQDALLIPTARFSIMSIRPIP